MASEPPNRLGVLRLPGRSLAGGGAMRKQPRSKALNVSVRMSRYTSNGSPSSGITLSIVDNASHLQIVAVDLPGFESMANLLTSHEASGEASVSGRPELWGLNAENKTAEVDYSRPSDYKSYDKAAGAACDLAEKQNPGWEADDYQRKHNGHRINGDKMTAHLSRWVKP